jgi:Coenzyme PQQ synthesis protein D (PqqD).
MNLIAPYPRRHPDTAFRQIGNEGGLVVLPGKAEVKVLNPVGIAVFSLLDGSRDVDGLAAAISGEFDIELDRAREDVIAFLDELQREGMLADAESPNERPS